MKIEHIENNSRIVNVVPVMKSEEFKKSSYYNYISANSLADFLILEDSSKDFCFSRNMNSGIQDAIDRGYNYIILSTDNLEFSNRNAIHQALRNLKPNRYYVCQTINSHRNTQNITTSPIKFLINGVLTGLPFYTLRIYLGMKKEHIEGVYAYRSAGKGFGNIMPFSVFDSRILYRFPFNEKIKNSLEDTWLSYQLWKGKVKMEVIESDVIHRGNQSFKKINGRHKLSGYYNFEDWKNNLKIIGENIKMKQPEVK